MNHEFFLWETFMNTKLIFLLLSFCSTQAIANPWQKIYSCENGVAYIDVNLNERRYLQLVFQGTDMLTKMRNAGFAWPQFGDTEFIHGGRHAEIKQISPTATEAVLMGGIYHSHDFKNFIAGGGDGGAIEAERKGDTLILRRYWIRAGTSCPEWNDMECRGGVYHKTWVFEAEYVLRGCHLN
jgi:hypothetical protein